MQKRVKFSDQIRRAIDGSGMSRYAICKELRFSESVMSKFMAGKCNLSMETLDRLADLLKLDVVVSAEVIRTPHSNRKAK
jgi:ribosome-binding protein aMBF1 (putative translation factor)